jgi:hypothetical protein
MTVPFWRRFSVFSMDMMGNDHPASVSAHIRIPEIERRSLHESYTD